jgi:hypothetical protein
MAKIGCAPHFCVGYFFRLMSHKKLPHRLVHHANIVFLTEIDVSARQSARRVLTHQRSRTRASAFAGDGWQACEIGSSRNRPRGHPEAGSGVLPTVALARDTSAATHWRATSLPPTRSLPNVKDLVNLSVGHDTRLFSSYFSASGYTVK